jgi:aspartyl-tRNA(Asn)/glutamyl-tRNA(Gln) amidotransferase subunit C
MVKVNDALILKLETLARLQLSGDERLRLQGDLEQVLAMIEKLEEVDTEGVLPLLHVVDQKQVLRADEVREQLTEEQALSNAPEKHGPYFSVPKVIDRS